MISNGRTGTFPSEVFCGSCQFAERCRMQELIAYSGIGRLAPSSFFCPPPWPDLVARVPLVHSGRREGIGVGSWRRYSG